jgi:hypothetical protein
MSKNRERPKPKPSDRELYVLEKLDQAVHALATGAGRVQERLEEAYRFLIAAQPNEVAEDELRRMLVRIKDDLTFDEPAGSEGRLKATLQSLSDEDASAIAARVSTLDRRL